MLFCQSEADVWPDKGAVQVQQSSLLDDLNGSRLAAAVAGLRSRSGGWSSAQAPLTMLRPLNNTHNQQPPSAPRFIDAPTGHPPFLHYQSRQWQYRMHSDRSVRGVCAAGVRMFGVCRAGRRTA